MTVCNARGAGIVVVQIITSIASLADHVVSILTIFYTTGPADSINRDIALLTKRAIVNDDALNTVYLIGATGQAILARIAVIFGTCLAGAVGEAGIAVISYAIWDTDTCGIEIVSLVAFYTLIILTK